LFWHDCTPNFPLVRTVYLLASFERDIYYPHMQIGKVWIYHLLFVFCLFLRLRISPARMKLAASNFALWFTGVLGRESPILGNFALPEAQSRTIGHPPRSKVQGGKSFRNRVPIKFAWRVDVGSACVDIRLSPKTGILVLSFCQVFQINTRAVT